MSTCEKNFSQFFSRKNHINVFSIPIDIPFSISIFPEEKEEMEHLQAYNKKLLSNILPVHVADHFLSCDTKNNDVSFLFMNINFVG